MPSLISIAAISFLFFPGQRRGEQISGVVVDLLFLVRTRHGGNVGLGFGNGDVVAGN